MHEGRQVIIYISEAAAGIEKVAAEYFVAETFPVGIKPNFIHTIIAALNEKCARECGDPNAADPRQGDGWLSRTKVMAGLIHPDAITGHSAPRWIRESGVRNATQCTWLILLIRIEVSQPVPARIGPIPAAIYRIVHSGVGFRSEGKRVVNLGGTQTEGLMTRQ
jgi:hypothetical protein